MFFSRTFILECGRWFLAQRYRVIVDGRDTIEDTGAVLVWPNHPAMVDPMLIVSEFCQKQLCPLVDEKFVNCVGPVSWLLKKMGAISVPDLKRHRTASSAAVARGLVDEVVDALRSGRSVLLYPSGHIWTKPQETIATRQLAYGVARKLPDGIRVVGVRTLGLWGSMWGRKGRRSSPVFVLTVLKACLLWPLLAVSGRRRFVTIHCEDLTWHIREWRGLGRLGFNRKLEAWYNDFIVDNA